MDSGGIWPGDESYFQNIRETALQDTIEQLTKELAGARAEIERKDKLIEQMRRALTKLIGTLEVMSVMPETLGKCPVLAIDAPELEQARAALAAERLEE